MTKKLRNIIEKQMDRIYPLMGIAIIIAIWQFVCVLEIVPVFMLPTPLSVLMALIETFPELMMHTKTSLIEAVSGLLISTVIAIIFAVVMDSFITAKKILYPLVITTQTIPAVAIAPLLVLWLGYGIAPKIALIVIVCFFPLVIGLLDGFQGVDTDIVNLLKAMKATPYQLFIHVKIPSSLPAFFTGFRIAASYSIVGAVIAEWLGGNSGLGVYMTKVRKSYSFDKMFAVILLITVISLIIIRIVSFLEKIVTPWRKYDVKEL